MIESEEVGVFIPSPNGVEDRSLETRVADCKKPNFFKRNFSGRHFKVQLASGTVCTVARAAAAFAAYNMANGSIEATIIATQVASGAAYVGSYSLVFYPIANRDKHSSYWAAVKASLGYQSIEQIPSLITIPVASATQFGVMKVGGDPILAAVLSSWGVNKVFNLAVGLSSSNFIYRHGGLQGVRDAIQGVSRLSRKGAASAVIFAYFAANYMPKW